MDITALYDRWVACADARYADDLSALATDETARTDAFYTELSFGTAGLRGILGAGPNRMNIHTVGKATQGLADYLNEHFDAPSVAIARDSRLCGEQFVEVAASVLAANGVRTYLYPRIEPTPALSFAVRDLHCCAGICVTASHNPAPYNGYKVYGPDGCQITTQAALDISAAIGNVDAFDDVKTMPFDEAIASGLASWMDEGTLDRFLEATMAQSTEKDGMSRTELNVVYTPLNGTGLECVTRSLEKLDNVSVTVVPEQEKPDGNFPTCPYPNPEIREALEVGLKLCSQVNPDILLATDPDADRVGVAVSQNGVQRLISGNEMGVLLCDYLAKNAQAQGIDLSDNVVVTTIVSSTMIDALARNYGFEVRRVLTGFKYIGEQIGLLERAGEEERFLFGFEESYGYLRGSHVRDKDAIVTSMLICQMARYYKKHNMNLADAIDALYAEYGFYKNGLINLGYPGAAGAERMKAIMGGLRGENAPKEIGGFKVLCTLDYQNGVEMPLLNARADDETQILPGANVIEFRLEGGNKVLVRPSGTEPKIKAYLFALGKTDAAGTEALETLDSAMRELLA